MAAKITPKIANEKKATIIWHASFLFNIRVLQSVRRQNGIVPAVWSTFFVVDVVIVTNKGEKIKIKLFYFHYFVIDIIWFTANPIRSLAYTLLK